MGAFHWKDGWMFAVGEANYVHIWKLDGDQPTKIELKIPRAEWDSIVKHLAMVPTQRADEK